MIDTTIVTMNNKVMNKTIKAMITNTILDDVDRSSTTTSAARQASSAAHRNRSLRHSHARRGSSLSWTLLVSSPLEQPWLTMCKAICLRAVGSDPVATTGNNRGE